jgi:hypothetical protein
VTPTQRALTWAQHSYAGTPSRRLVLLTIALNAEIGATPGAVRCDLSVEKIAQLCEMATPIAGRALRELEAGGAIEVVRRGGTIPNRIVIRYDRHPVDLTAIGGAR